MYLSLATNGPEMCHLPVCLSLEVKSPEMSHLPVFLSLEVKCPEMSHLPVCLSLEVKSPEMLHLPVYRSLAVNGSAPTESMMRGSQIPSVRLMVVASLSDSRPGSPSVFTARAPHCTRLPGNTTVHNDELHLVLDSEWRCSRVSSNNNDQLDNAKSHERQPQ